MVLKQRSIPEVTRLPGPSQGFPVSGKLGLEQQEGHGQPDSGYVLAQIRWQISSLGGASKEESEKGKFLLRAENQAVLAKEVITTFWGLRNFLLRIVPFCACREAHAFGVLGFCSPSLPGKEASTCTHGLFPTDTCFSH